MKFKVCLMLVFLHVSAFAQSDYYPQDEIENFLQLGPKDMINFIRTQEIDLFKFETDAMADSEKESQDFLRDLRLVNKNDFNHISDLFDGGTLGVFFSHHNSYYRVKKDTLILSSEADMWTIAHEVSHALIDKNRHRNKIVREDHSFELLSNAKDDYEEAMSMYKTFGKFLSTARAEETFETIKIWTTLTTELLYTYELEEVKIERALRNLFENKRSHKLIKSSYERSPLYSKSNCQ